MKILIIEPYLTGSHAAWVEGYKRHSRNDVEILSLPGRYWKWRMHGGAVTLAKKFLAGDYAPDLILATDMLDLTTFLALTRERTASMPTALYFHENQLTYPWAPDDRDIKKGRDGHYGFINFSSALVADKVFFNSHFHMEEFYGELERYLKGLPDFTESDEVDALRKKSSVLYPPIDFEAINDAGYEEEPKDGPPLILWNHRWEHDKNPVDFFKVLYELNKRGCEFELALLGENFTKNPAVFDEAKKRLADKIVHFGYVESFADYAGWLGRADILPVTSIHDFFGCSVVEAIYMGVYPILPRRLAYPEHIPAELQKTHLYDNLEELLEKLLWAVGNIEELRKTKLRHIVEGYGWQTLGPKYDAEIEGVFKSSKYGLI